MMIVSQIESYFLEFNRWKAEKYFVYYEQEDDLDFKRTQM